MRYKEKIALAHMKAALAYADCSHDTRLKVGAIIVKNDSVIAIGYNGRPAGEDNACQDEHGVTHPHVIHAEDNALRKLVRSHESSVGATIFQTHSPCILCAIKIADAGIQTVYFQTLYRDNSGLKYLKERNINVFQIEVETRDVQFIHPTHPALGNPQDNIQINQDNIQ